MAVINGVILKGRCEVIPESLQNMPLEQLHASHMGIEKTKLLACESIYWTNINDDIEKHIKNCSTCLDFQQTQPKEKIMHPKIPAKPWKIVGRDMFILHHKTLFVM